jgi:hypothetical protein
MSARMLDRRWRSAATRAPLSTVVIGDIVSDIAKHLRHGFAQNSRDTR